MNATENVDWGRRMFFRRLFWGLATVLCGGLLLRWRGLMRPGAKLTPGRYYRNLAG